MASTLKREGSSSRRGAPSPDDVPTQAAAHQEIVAEVASTASAAILPQHTLEGDLPPSSPDDKTVISKRPPLPELLLPMQGTPQQLGVMLIGKKLEHYELVEFVGGGGMGAVFRAIDTRLGRTVAVKVLSRDGTDDETIRRFRNEAQSAARLDHPNIARVHYVGDDSGWNYIVFEFIDGVNLRDTVDQNGPLPLDDAFSYTLQVAEALEHAASRDVVHRDIKPSNVLLMSSGTVKLVDMGLARLHQVESSSEDLTASGVTLGTFDYISPEQARDPRAADVRSDIYSLGCTLYYMLVGQPPFPDGTALQKLLRHNADEPPDVRMFRPELSTKVSGLLTRMLAKRPSQRYQTPAELISEILQIAEQLGLTSVSQRGATWVPPPPTVASLWARAVPIVVPIALLVGLVFVLDAYLPSGSATTDISLRPKLAASPIVDTAGPLIATEPPAEPLVGVNENVSLTPGDMPAAAPPLAATPPEPEARMATAADVAPLVPTTDLVTGNSQAMAVKPPLLPPTESAVTPGSAEVAGRLGTPVEVASIGAEAIGVEAAISAAASSTSSEAPPAEISKLVVIPGAETEVSGETERHGSLAAACRRAAELGLSEIELQFDGELLERPFEVALSRLTIRAAADMHPLLVFRPASAGVASERIMIRSASTGSSRLQFQNVNLRLELPAESASGWSLFALSPQQVLELNDCVLTIRDHGPFGAPNHVQVAAIAVQSRRSSEMMLLDEEIGMSQPATILLNRCLVRGQAALVSMPDETPLAIEWNQGLFVSTQHLLETGGTTMKPTVFSRIEIDLTHVTLMAQQGIYQMRRRSGTDHHLDVDVQSNNNILSPSLGATLFEFTGIATEDEVKLKFAGGDNCYPRVDLAFVRVKPANGAETDFDLNHRERWSQERRPDPAVEFRSPPPAGLPVDQHTKQHYLLSEDTMSDAGFDPSLLPDVVPVAPAPQPQPAADDSDDAAEPAPLP